MATQDQKILKSRQRASTISREISIEVIEVEPLAVAINLDTFPPDRSIEVQINTTDWQEEEPQSGHGEAYEEEIQAAETSIYHEEFHQEDKDEDEEEDEADHQDRQPSRKRQWVHAIDSADERSFVMNLATAESPGSPLHLGHCDRKYSFSLHLSIHPSISVAAYVAGDLNA